MAKLHRLINYMEVKSFQGTLATNVSGEEDIATATAFISPDTGPEDAKPCGTPRPKRTKLCRDFVTSIDQTGELAAALQDSIFDEVKHERYLRAEAQTRCMDQAQYFEYSNARRSSFCAKQKSARFRDWLLKDVDLDIKPTSSVLEVFNYLAYETVAQIVDLALLVKKDAKSCPGDPMSWSMPPAVFNPGFPCVQIPSTQERQASLSSEAAPAGAESSTGGTLAETESITPSEIREAIRRYWKHRGPLACFMKQWGDCPGKRLLSC
ncbi:transcription initiation protein SPT3 homolog isoform X2 [Ixodes scapularis]